MRSKLPQPGARRPALGLAAAALGLWALGEAAGNSRGPQPIRLDGPRDALPGDPPALHPDGHLGVVVGEGLETPGFDAAGRLVELGVRLGERVRAGDAIARLDGRAAEARLEQRRAEAAVAEADLARAEAEWRLARETYERRAKAPQVFSAEQVEVAREQERMAAAGVKRSEAELARARAAEAAERAEGEALVLRAPLDGVVAARLAEPGAQLAAGAPVVRLVPDGDLWVRFAVPPALAPGLEGTRVWARDANAFDGEHAQGPWVALKVVRVAPLVDGPSGLVFAEARLAPPERERLRLAPGARVRVRP